MSLEWSAITTIVLGSSFLGAALTNLVGWVLKREERLRQTGYLGLNLAYAFEGFAYTCLSAVEDHDTAKSSNEHAGKYITKLPEFPKLPEFDYRDMDLSILDMVFDFPQQVVFANESLLFAFNVCGDPKDAVEEGYLSCLQLAQKSLLIADRTRQRYRLKKRVLRFGEYSVLERLNEKSSQAQK